MPAKDIYILFASLCTYLWGYVCRGSLFGVFGVFELILHLNCCCSYLNVSTTYLVCVSAKTSIEFIQLGVRNE